MRVYKIILIIILAFTLFMMVFGMIEIYGSIQRTPELIYAIIFIVFGLVAGVLAFIYHIKSFRYYRASKQKEKVKKLPLILWIGAIATGVYYLLFGIFGILGTVENTAETGTNKFEVIMTICMIVILVFGVFSLVETSILKKRIKRLQTEHTTKDEISSIGSSSI